MDRDAARDGVVAAVTFRIDGPAPDTDALRAATTLVEALGGGLTATPSGGDVVRSTCGCPSVNDRHPAGG